jgi:hypothetical protein
MNRESAYLGSPEAMLLADEEDIIICVLSKIGCAESTITVVPLYIPFEEAGLWEPTLTK